MERLLRATINTWHGLRAAARSEEAFRQELVALVLAVPRPPSVPIPKFASLCGALACELRKRRTLATY